MATHHGNGRRIVSLIALYCACLTSASLRDNIFALVLQAK
jgi:hypothetical protein